MLFMCVRLFMLLIRERLFIIFTKESFFMLFKFQYAVYKILYYFYTYIFYGNFALGWGPGTDYS